MANVLKNQRGVELESRASFKQEEGGCDSRKVVRVERVRYGDGNPDAGVGDGVTRWGLQILEEKARLIDCEGLVSLQEDARLVKETLDATKSGSAEVVRRDGKQLFSSGRNPVDGQGGQSSKWAEPGGPTGNGKPSLHRAKFPFKRAGLGLSKKKGQWVVTVRPNILKGLKKGLAHASLLRLPASKSGEFKTELSKPAFVGESSEQEAPPLDQGRSDSPLKSFMLGIFPFSTAFGGGVRGIFWPFFSFFFGDGGFCGVPASMAA